MKVVPVPCLKDNYAYLVICEDTGLAGVVDPSESQPVLMAIEEHKVKLVAILQTHHHWDHIGGNKELLQLFPELEVYGHESDHKRIPGQTIFLKEGDKIKIGNLTGTFTHNPAHTTGAITYYFEDSAFTGDTLFGAGCGRLFEGTAGQMHKALNTIIGNHPPHTKLYFGHEYTLSNLKFALAVEPSNPAITQRLQKVQELRDQGKFTTPSTLEEEWATNPFMRCDVPEIQQTVHTRDPKNDLSPRSVFKALRAYKDNF